VPHQLSVVAPDVVLPAVPGEVVIGGVVPGPLVQSAVAWEVVVTQAEGPDTPLVVVRVMVGRVVGPVPPDLDCVAAAVVVRAVIDAAHAREGDPPFKRLETQTAATALLA
jgi:hypothetical protein